MSRLRALDTRPRIIDGPRREPGERSRAVHRLNKEDPMKTSRISMGIALAALGLAVAPGLASAQQPNGIGGRSELKPVDSVRPLHGSRGSQEIDFAAARADAHAKAHARQNTDVDVKNKLDQKQAAIGIGTGGKSSVNLKNTNTNLNSLSTGDVVNFNVNDNKQVQSFTVPVVPFQRAPVKALR
jgi:hypothetical protein